MAQSAQIVDDSGTAELLQEERKRASFDPRRLTYLLDGGKEKTERKEKIRQIVENDPV